MHEAAAAGESVVYGDAAKREVLMAAGLMRAKTLVITYNDKHSALKILHHVNQMRPDLPVVVRTTDDTHIEELKKAGAAEVVAEVTGRQRDAGLAGAADVRRAAEPRDPPRPGKPRRALCGVQRLFPHRPE